LSGTRIAPPKAIPRPAEIYPCACSLFLYPELQILDELGANLELPVSSQVEKHFTEAEIQRVLIELAACSGNTLMAARRLKEGGLSIDQKTIWRWKTRQHVERYERIQEDVMPEVQRVAAEEHMQLARQQTMIAQDAANRVAERIPAMEDRDLINAMGKADVGSGIHTEKALLLSGQPTSRVENDFAKLVKVLEERHNLRVTFDGECEEEPPDRPALTAGG